MNCMLIKHGKESIVVDAGVLFPDRDLGVQVVHPDFGWLKTHGENLKGLVITHGHEDHIGAVPYLLKAHPMPVYAPPYAMGLIQQRLAEHHLGHVPVLQTTHVAKPFKVGPFEIEHIRVTHSIVDATALAIRWPHGLMIHSGDFKIDDNPPDGQHFDATRLQALGDEGVDLLLSDSTNALSEGRSGSESDVLEALEARVAEAKGRVVVAIFASNVHRLAGLLRIAKRQGRRVCLLGRSVIKHKELSESLAMLGAGRAELVPSDVVDRVPPEELLVIATGTQGERQAALGRLAEDRHPALSLAPGDTVLMSSRIIPGNEQSVFDVVNAFEKRGIKVGFRLGDPDIHASGHAYRDEQRTLLRLTRPKAFVPVHGTFLHMRAHAEIAESEGVVATAVIENGQELAFDEGRLVRGEHLPIGRVHVGRGGPVSAQVLRERTLLAELGIAVFVGQVDAQGQIVGDTDVVTQGLLDEEADQRVLDRVCDYVCDAIEAHARRRPDADLETLEDVARRALRRIFGYEVGHKPLASARLHRAVTR